VIRKKKKREKDMGKTQLFGIMFIFFCFSVSAQAGLRVIIEESAAGFTIIGTEGRARDLIIPESIGGIPIIAIGENAFIRSGLTMVTIPDTVITIGEGAFSHNDLTTLAIGDNVTTIGQRSFSHNRLNDLTIGAGVTTIGLGAFANNHLETLIIPDGVVTIDAYAFFLQQAY
jgi:acetyltransferase-like isoleucine patch superfamily enzyme